MTLRTTFSNQQIKWASTQAIRWNCSLVATPSTSSVLLNTPKRELHQSFSSKIAVLRAPEMRQRVKELCYKSLRKSMTIKNVHGATLTNSRLNSNQPWKNKVKETERVTSQTGTTNNSDWAAKNRQQPRTPQTSSHSQKMKVVATQTAASRDLIGWCRETISVNQL